MSKILNIFKLMNKKNLHVQQSLKLAYENHQKGNLKLAKSLYEKILKVDKNNSESIFLLGCLFLQKREFEKAIELLNRSIKIQPKNPNTYQNLGYAYVELGNFKKSIDLFNKAIEINPNHADAHFNLGNAYKQLRDFENAKSYYEKAIKIQPNNPSAYNNLGNVYKKIGLFSEAINSYEKAIHLKPNHARAYHNLGNTFSQLGEFSKAINSFKMAFQIQPSNLESLDTWSDLDEKILNSDLRKKIIEIIKNKYLTKKDSSYGNFLFAKYEYRDRNFEEELNYLLEGHKLYFESQKNAFEKGVNYWLKDLPKISELENFNKNNMASNIKPIFIIGVPRCGSTLVEKIIASGGKTIPIGEETGVISYFIGEKILEKKSIVSESKNIKDNVINKYDQLKLLNKENDHIFTDKTLDNFFFLDFINKVFPKSKVINCKRNAIASIISILKNNLGDVSWAHNLEHIFKYFDIYYRKVDFFKKKFPNFIYDLDLESLQNDPENESKKLMKFCELPWDKKCLEFYKRKDLISYTASQRQIRKAIYKESSDKNKPYFELLKKYGKNYTWFK